MNAGCPRCGGADSTGRTCGCCIGVEVVTPRIIYNRPGLPVLGWRVAEYADLLETMSSRISQVWVDVETGAADPHGRGLLQRVFPLRGLLTRSADDPTMALLDAWAVLGDVLTFYSERIANEGFLSTATELRSVVWLARLVGYRRRPGVAASAYLAFTADAAWTGADPLRIPAGARVQSLPQPNQVPLPFETDADLQARPEWNTLLPRKARPAFLPQSTAADVTALDFQGTDTNLTANAALLLVYGDAARQQVLRFVATVVPDFVLGQTRANLVGGPSAVRPMTAPVDLDRLVQELERRPSIPPASPAQLSLTPAQTFGPGSPATDALTLAFHPLAARSLFTARANAQAASLPDLQIILAFRVKAAVYANTAPPVLKTQHDGSVVVDHEWPLVETTVGAPGVTLARGQKPPLNVLDMDTTYDAIVPDRWVVVRRPFKTASRGRPSPLSQLITRVTEVQTVNRTDYNFPSRVTRLILRDDWLDADDQELSAVRSTTVYAAPDPLTLADQPIDDPVCRGELELDRQVNGLQPGRRLIISGERASAGGDPGADTFNVPGVPVTEILMLSGVRNDTLYVAGGKVVPPSALAPGQAAERLPGDRIHTFLQLANDLAFCYRRDTVKIFANVARATHGETRSEAMGSGDGAKPFQSFTLQNAPLTYTAAATSSGIASSLHITVNDTIWQEADNPLDLGAADRAYTTNADAGNKTSATFGDGRHGARLPTGIENVRALYRSGIGQSGNVRPNQLTQLVTNVNGLRSVTNPQEASGGADPEGTDSTRSRAPLAVTSLDRLVATQDYADFSRVFAGIAKASAGRLPTPHGQVVQVTIAGENDIPIEPTSDLFRSLLAALENFGDPWLPVKLVRRELLLLVISARVGIDPDHLWDNVRPQLQAALWSHFGFARRQLAQDAYAADAVACMQAVPGVTLVDLDLFAVIAESTPPSALANLGRALSGAQDRIIALPDRLGPRDPLSTLPAQLIVLSADIPTTLLLTEVTYG
jgi:predicted phage baseplate assembly protein